MALETKCPKGCSLKVPNRYLGKRVRCPKCHVTFVVPEQDDWSSTEKAAAPHQQEDRNGDLPVIEARDANRARSRGLSENKSPTDLESRTEQSRRERVLTCRYFAVLLGLVGIVSAIPAVGEWWNWLGSDLEPLPVWVGLSFFLAGWQVQFAILLLQIPDWSTLKASAVASLLVVCGYGLSATVFSLSSADGWLNKWLGLPGSYFDRASMWCLAMMALTIVASLACYREGQRWKRLEDLLAQLLIEK